METKYAIFNNKSKFCWKDLEKRVENRLIVRLIIVDFEVIFATRSWVLVQLLQHFTWFASAFSEIKIFI